MRFFGFLVIAGLAYWIYSAWTAPGTYTDRVERLSQQVEAQSITTFGSDYWLIDATGGKVALIFGYMDNSSFCEEVADLIRARDRRNSVGCQSAN